MRHQPNQRGFTLVELSIVLVILGLLVGGVLAGQSLIRAAELRAVTTERNQFLIALNAFREKYFAVPGDMTNAVRFWGAAAGGTADGVDSTCANYTTAGSGTATCNGDGNGFVDNGPGVASGKFEIFRAWQHLANAGLIEGSYTGVVGPSGVEHAIAGTNVPKSKIGSASWTMWWASNIVGHSSYYQGSLYRNYLFFGGDTSNDLNYNNIITAAEAYNIDTKTDDGKPNTGNTLSFTYVSRPDCVESTDDAYQLSSAVVGCSLIFVTK